MRSIKFLIAFLIPFTFACSEIEDEPTEIDLDELVMEFDDFIFVIDEINNYQSNIEKNNGPYSVNSGNPSEEELELILNPMLDNGNAIHIQFKEVIYSSGVFDELTTQEQNELSSEIDVMTDEQLVELSLIVNVNYYSEQMGSEDIDWNRISHCVQAAVGVEALKTIIINSAEAAAVETIIGALKLVGKRYLGWIGVGYMIYSFVQCIQ